ncbi:PH domain-containing protein [Arenimonas sp.]|uniref:PH domain-containing protein n=1 Tax=Arenimonas sp. TaxID=1872635 RepID=UPI0039E5099B
MKTQEFEFTPPGAFPRLFPLLIGAGIPLILVAVLALQPQPVTWMHILPALLLLPVVGAAFAWTMHRRRIRIEGGGIRYRLMPGTSTRLIDLDLDSARIVDLEQETSLRPVFRLFGTALPGYRSGWFRLRNRATAYVVLSDWRRVLVLPRRDGRLLLFSLQKPEMALEALRRG